MHRNCHPVASLSKTTIANCHFCPSWATVPASPPLTSSWTNTRGFPLMPGTNNNNMASHGLTYEGCNFFRQRLVLSTLSGKRVKIRSIRSKEDEPGLRGKFCGVAVGTQPLARGLELTASCCAVGSVASSLGVEGSDRVRSCKYEINTPYLRCFRAAWCFTIKHVCFITNRLFVLNFYHKFSTL